MPADGGRAALTVGDKHRMTAQEVCRACPHDPHEANPCPCGIRWDRDIDGDWGIADRWATGWWPKPLVCLAHMEDEPCQTCAAYIAAGL